MQAVEKSKIGKFVKNMQSSYALLLDDRLKPLGYFADEALQAVSDYDVFRLILVDWFASAKQSVLLNPLQNLWDENFQKYLQQYNKTKKRAAQQVKDAYILIKQRLRSKRLLEDREIADKLSSIERILNGEEKIRLRPHYAMVKNFFKDKNRCMRLPKTTFNRISC